MVYFPYLVTTFYKRHGVPQKAINEVCHPHAAFNKAVIQTLMKPKGKKRQPEARQGSIGEEASFETDHVL